MNEINMDDPRVEEFLDTQDEKIERAAREAKAVVREQVAHLLSGMNPLTLPPGPVGHAVWVAYVGWTNRRANPYSPFERYGFVLTEILLDHFEEYVPVSEITAEFWRRLGHTKAYQQSRIVLDAHVKTHRLQAAGYGIEKSKIDGKTAYRLVALPVFEVGERVYLAAAKMLYDHASDTRGVEWDGGYVTVESVNMEELAALTVRTDAGQVFHVYLSQVEKGVPVGA